jgi:release factor glutamine methyltransferase
MKKYGEILREAEQRLTEAGVPEPKLDAWYLFEEEFHMSRAEYLIRRQEEAPVLSAEWNDKIEKRCHRVPLQYILGQTEFMGLTFFVGPGVLIPRQDTETLVELVLQMEKRQQERDNTETAVLDLCTGSGCIGLSLAVLGDHFHVSLTDLSGDALEIARKNRDHLCPEVEIYQGDLFQGIPSYQKYDVIVSNPPYIESAVIEDLQQEVKSYEPRMALDGMADGLFFYRRIAEEGKQYMKSGARIYLEIGYDQGRSVPEILTTAGFTNVTVYQDLAGLDRVVRGEYQSV